MFSLVINLGAIPALVIFIITMVNKYVSFNERTGKFVKMQIFCCVKHSLY